MPHISVGFLYSIQFAFDQFLREHVSVFEDCAVVGLVKDHRASTREYLIL